MRRPWWLRWMGVVGLAGAAGLTAVVAALVNELLSPWWAALTVIALAACLVAATAAVMRARTRVRRMLTEVVADGAESRVSVQTRAMERALAAHDQSVQRRMERQARQTRKDLDGLYSQFEALDALYRRLEPPRPLPPLRRWAISPDLALHLVGLVLDGEVRNVLETGSGSSTVLLGLALEKLGSGCVVALEHDPTYAAETRRMLEQFGLTERARVVDAPLVPVVVGEEDFLWYDLAGAKLPTNVDLLLVDGPPESTGRQARFPALPLLRDALADDALIVLDDGDRADEAEIARRWAALDGVGQVRTLTVERNALQLRVGLPGTLRGGGAAVNGRS